MKYIFPLLLLVPAVVIALVFVFGFSWVQHSEIWADDEQTATTTQNQEQDQEVEDITDEDVNKFPFDLGKFELKGRVTAVDLTAKTISVNGLVVYLADGAKIRRGNVRTLEGVSVGDRVAMSGTIRDGKLLVQKVVVKGFAPAFGRTTQEDVQKLRSEIEKRIQEILKQIEEIRKQIRERGGSPASAQ